MDKETQEASSLQVQEVLSSLQLNILTKVKVKSMNTLLTHPKDSQDPRTLSLHQKDLDRAAKVRADLLARLASPSFCSLQVFKLTGGSGDE